MVGVVILRLRDVLRIGGFGFHGGELDNMLLWVLGSGLVCGIAGGLFGQFLYKGAAAFSPQKWRDLIVRHPLLLAAAMGVLLALLGHGLSGADLRYGL